MQVLAPSLWGHPSLSGPLWVSQHPDPSEHAPSTERTGRGDQGAFQAVTPTPSTALLRWNRMACSVWLIGKTYRAPCKRGFGSTDVGPGQVMLLLPRVLTPAPGTGGGELLGGRAPRKGALLQARMQLRIPWAQTSAAPSPPGGLGSSALEQKSDFFPHGWQHKTDSNGHKYRINSALFIYHKTFDLDVFLGFIPSL